MGKKHVKCWDSLEEKLKQVAEVRRPECAGEARLAVALLVSAGRDRDVRFVDSNEFTEWCLVCKISPHTMKQLIQWTWEHIDGNRSADFNFDFDEVMGV